MKQDIVVTRVLEVPVEQVWQAWVDSERVKQWWGPTGFTCPLARMDVREGGTSLVCMRAPAEFGGQDFYNTWTYTQIVPQQRLEYLLDFADQHGRRIDPASVGLPADMPRDVRNLVTFKALDGGRTEMTVTEFDWTVGPMREMSKLGLEQCLDKMAASLG